MAKRVNVRRLLRKHRAECIQRLDGISMYEDRPYDHNTEQIIKACEDDIRMIDKIVFTFFENTGEHEIICLYDQDMKCTICGTKTQIWVNQITGSLTCHRYGCENIRIR